jgi:hypothetical protein
VRSYWIEKKNERKKMKMEMRNYRENERDDEKIDRRRSVVVVVVMNLRDGEEMRSRSVNLSRDEN